MTCSTFLLSFDRVILHSLAISCNGLGALLAPRFFSSNNSTFSNGLNVR